MRNQPRMLSTSLAVCAALFMLAGCGGGATAPPVPTGASPSAAPPTATVAPAATSAALFPTVTAGVTAAPTAVATALPTSAPTVTVAIAAAPTATGLPAPAANTVPPLGITAPDKWFNSEPLTLEGLRGRPVLLIFWSDI